MIFENMEWFMPRKSERQSNLHFARNQFEMDSKIFSRPAEFLSSIPTLIWE